MNRLTSIFTRMFQPSGTASPAFTPQQLDTIRHNYNAVTVSSEEAQRGTERLRKAILAAKKGTP